MSSEALQNEITRLKKAHNIWLCPDCLAEIDDTICLICGEDFEVEGVNEHSIATVSDAEHIDRLPPSKAAAPNLAVNSLPLSRIPASWQTSEADIAEYRQLIAQGIIAYADTLFDEFSGPAMKDGMSGRSISGVELNWSQRITTHPSMVDEESSGRRVGDEAFQEAQQAWTEEYDYNSEDSDWESGSGADGAKGDGGEWDSEEDDLEVAESWEPEECLNDAETEEPVLVNRYYESDSSSGEEDEGGDMEDAQPSSSTLTDVKEEEPGEKVTDEADVDMDSAAEDASSESDGDVCGSDWDQMKN
ncbi:hypothetical protein BKA70DRAFT_1563208 [Coprinopsis sp. MPI-PUGE-AT-0042]|nr:hypothetical protein BKA70DRAFT_1563208 [Coprinopsis sp. MPI-PUGE-AT-0042]